MRERATNHIDGPMYTNTRDRTDRFSGGLRFNRLADSLGINTYPQRDNLGNQQ